MPLIFLRVFVVAFVLVVISFDLNNCRIIKVLGYEQLPAPNNFTCKEDGFFPNEKDCRMFWYCEYKEDFELDGNLGEAIGQEKSTLNPFQRVRLFKCPENYLYDESIHFCQPSFKVQCSYPRLPRKQNIIPAIMSPWGTLNDFR